MYRLPAAQDERQGHHLLPARRARLPFSPNRDKKKWFPKVTAHSATRRRREAGTSFHTQSATLLTNWLRGQKMIYQQSPLDGIRRGRSVLKPSWHARQPAQACRLEDVTRGSPIAGCWWARAAGAIREANPADLQRVGVLLPNVNGTPVSLLGLWFHWEDYRRCLNYLDGRATMLALFNWRG